MGTGQNSANDLEQLRYQVEENKIVVHGAEITCNWSGKSKIRNCLSILDGHGIMEAGKNCAHDGSCIPFKNISPFSSCQYYDAKKALTALSAIASGEEKVRYEAALKVIADNEAGYSYTPVPCTLPLLERWFDADEKEIVTDSMEMEVRIKQKIIELKRDLQDSLKKGASDLYDTYVLVLYLDNKLSPEEKVAYCWNSEKLKAICDEINQLCDEIAQTINTKVQLRGEKFASTLIQLNKAGHILQKILDCWENAHEIYEYLKNYQEYKDSLEDFQSEIENIINKINNWKEKEYHLITTESFLVCRCGGIISIADSGQSFGNVVDEIMSSLLTMLAEFKEHCIIGMEQFCSKESDFSDHEWSSYKIAAKGLEQFEKMLLNNSEGEKGPEEVCAYIELICHSYNEEISKILMSALSLISLESNALAFLLAVYTVGTIDETTQGAIDGISADITALEAIADDVGEAGAKTKQGIVTQLGGGAIVQFNNLYTIVTSVANFFYFSYDTYIETIQITVFTNTHAHVRRCSLNRKGELESQLHTSLYTKADYIAGNLGRGLKWKEEPGAYARNLIHKGDNDEGNKIENKNEVNEAVPLPNS